MTSIRNDLSLSHNNNFALKIDKLDGVSFFANSVVTPGITLPVIENATPKIKVKTPGSFIEFEPFVCTFLVDEDWENWISVFDWMQSFTCLDDVRDGLTDFSVIVPNNHGNLGKSFRYERAFPYSLESINLNSDVSEPVANRCSLTMAYQWVEIEKA